jgi:hypothetical protein
MVSKLLLAAQECFFQAIARGASSSATRTLADLYYRIREGLSFNKTPEVYGAIPLDPYSHTPGHCGAQQPGMTGQVKEEILTRAGELGVTVRAGVLSFEPVLLRKSEFLTAPATWDYVDIAGKKQELLLPAKSLAFTVCQTPVQMMLGDAPGICVRFVDGHGEAIFGSALPAALSQCVLTRAGTIALIEVTIAQSVLSHA